MPDTCRRAEAAARAHCARTWADSPARRYAASVDRLFLLVARRPDPGLTPGLPLALRRCDRCDHPDTAMAQTTRIGAAEGADQPMLNAARAVAEGEGWGKGDGRLSSREGASSALWAAGGRNRLHEARWLHAHGGRRDACAPGSADEQNTCVLLRGKGDQWGWVGGRWAPWPTAVRSGCGEGMGHFERTGEDATQLTLWSSASRRRSGGKPRAETRRCPMQRLGFSDRRGWRCDRACPRRPGKPAL
eukprot:357951-Chlamydomonas_euryale.AAC.8